MTQLISAYRNVLGLAPTLNLAALAGAGAEPLSAGFRSERIATNGGGDR
jgi:hypothetical protein